MESLNAYAGARVAVTGASGYIGSVLAARLRRAGADVLAADRSLLSAPSAAAPLVDREVIFHLASNTSVRAAAADPGASVRATVAPLRHLAAAARAHGHRPRVVLASTVTVYGVTDGCVDERAVPAPATTYDAHKWEAEQVLAEATVDGVIDGVTLRIANVYGESPAPVSSADRGFLNRAIARALAGNDLSFYGDGAYVRDFIHVDDVASALLAAGRVREPRARCFNVVTAIGTPMRDALELIATTAARITGRRVAVSGTEWPPDALPIDRRSFAGSNDRIRAELGWAPHIGLAEGIARTMESSVQSCA